MSKKLLSEAVVRRFARLANLPVINEEAFYGGNKGDKPESEEDFKPKNESLYEEDAEEEIADEVGMEDDSLPIPDQDELADIGGEEEGGEMGMDLGSREELAMDVISAVADALNIEVDIEGGEPEMDAEMDIGDAEDDLEAAGDLDADAFADEEDAIMEALRGINYVPGKKEIVNEVAKRVAKRLLKAKQAQKQLQEALGGGPRRTPRKTAKTTATRQRTRSTRNARRRTKK